MNNNICVVTGATSGIGRATAIGLAKLGAKVVIVARNLDKAKAVVAEIAAISDAPAAEIVLADLVHMEQVRNAADEIRARFERVDVLVNNAGGMFDTSVGLARASSKPMRSTTWRSSCSPSRCIQA